MLALAYHFRATHEYAQAYLSEDERAFTVKYEELVVHPEATLERACSFLGIDYQQSLLDTSDSAKRVSSDREPWKRQVGGSLDHRRLYVWRREMEPDMVDVVSAVMSNFIRDFRYEAVGEGNPMVAACMNMTYDNITNRQRAIIERTRKGVMLEPVSFREGLRRRSGFWLRDECEGDNRPVRMVMLMLLNLTPWFSYRII